MTYLSIETHHREFTSGSDLMEHYRMLFQRTRPSPTTSIIRREDVPSGMTEKNFRPATPKTLYSDRPSDVDAAFAALDPDRFRKPIRMGDIIDVTAAYLGYSRDDLRGRGRDVALMRSRQIAMYLGACLTGSKYREVATMIGGRTHTSVNWAVDRISTMLRADERLSLDITILTSILHYHFEVHIRD